jgi:hypothetical protein
MSVGPRFGAAAMRNLGPVGRKVPKNPQEICKTFPKRREAR